MTGSRLVLLLVTGVVADDNGLAQLPPMGWRSWNAFYADINDATIRSQIDALMLPRAQNGEAAANGTSLFDLGFVSIGIDEGWEGCGLGINGTVHYANGTPAVDPKRFPSMPDLVSYGHAQGVKMGFYLNGCGCTEHTEKRINYEGDVLATVGWGFDGVKIDSCGAQKNSTLYHELFNATGVPLVVEQCHQGHNITDGGNPDQMGPGWCPYHFFRTSGDIVNLWDRVMSNLLTVVPFLQHSPTPLSRPGCWAYPDMLEVGRMPEHNDAESRSHFSAWALVSAPLVLGFDLSDQAKLAQAWPIISNREVIEISQSYVKGAPNASGALLRQWQAPNVPTLLVRGACDDSGCQDRNAKCAAWAASGECLKNPGYMKVNCQRSCGACAHGEYATWRYESSSGGAGLLRAGDVCLDSAGQLPAGHDGGNRMQMEPCAAPAVDSQQWEVGAASAPGTSAPGASAPGASAPGLIRSATAAAPCLTAYAHWLWDYQPVVALGSCSASSSAAQWTLHDNGTLSNGQFGCVEVSRDSGPPSTIWAKPLPRGRVALLAINGADLAQQMPLDFAALGYAGAWGVRDVWAAQDLGLQTAIERSVGAHDCLLLVLSPAPRRPAAHAAERER